jgi:hypothetical protein
MSDFRNVLVRYQNSLVIKLVVIGFRSKSTNSYIRLGTSYGGWWVPSRILENNAQDRTLVSVGLGFDVSFDEALLKSGFEVLGLDPLSESLDYANRVLGAYPKFIGVQKGLWKSSGTEKFFPPKNPLHDSWSITNIQNAEETEFKVFDVISLNDLFEHFPQLQSSEYCAIKIDAEGAEVALIPEIAQFKRKFELVAIEMDFLSLIPFFAFQKRVRLIIKARKLLVSLRSRGYHLFKNDNFNFFWE